MTDTMEAPQSEAPATRRKPSPIRISPLPESEHYAPPLLLTFARDAHEGDHPAVRAVFTLEVYGGLLLENCLLVQDENRALKVIHPAVCVKFYGRTLRGPIRDAVLAWINHDKRSRH
jgi:hypothetical protein